MSFRVVDHELQRAKRELRLQIGRRRRRIDGRIHALRREARRLASWRTYVRGYPGCAVAAAFGVGLAASAGLSRRRLARWLGLRLLGRAADQVGRAVRQELKRIWDDSTPEKTPKPSHGAHDDQT